MRCPRCRGVADKVIDSRFRPPGNYVHRRRICAACGHRFTTYEFSVERRQDEQAELERAVEVSADRIRREGRVR